MSDWDEARQDAMDEMSGQYVGEGRTEMQNEVIDLIDDTIRRLFDEGVKLGDPRFAVLEELKAQVEKLD